MPCSRHSPCKPSLRHCLVALTLALVGHGAYAAPPPTGGQLLQEVPTPTPPSAPQAPHIVIVRPEGSAMAEGNGSPGAAAEAFPVTRIEFTGNVALGADKIRAVIASSEGKSLTLGDLQKLADRITELYRDSGYPFSQAYIPAQTIKDGLVHLTILEATYGEVTLHNASRIRDSVPRTVLSQLKPGMSVDQASLDRVLLLTSDLPATSVKGTLSPGTTLGTSNLQVDVEPAPAVNGSVSADDYGNAATGRERLNANINLDNPLRLGDILSASALTEGRGLNYGRLGYDLPIYGPATQLEAHASTLDYKIVHGSAIALGSHGTASVFGGGIQQFLLRSTGANVTGNLVFEDTALRDDVNVSDVHTDRHTQDWHASVTAVVGDATGVTNLNGGVTLGRVIFDNSTARLVDGSGGNTAGQFTKYVMTVSRLQNLFAKTSLYVSANYQGASKNLDSSEQLFIGGPYSVRAYDNGVISGTQGNVESVELRRELMEGPFGRWQTALFFDHAQVQIEKNPYTAGPNAANLSGVGVGLNWLAPHGWLLNSAVSTPVGATPIVVGARDSVRFWVQLQTAF